MIRLPPPSPHRPLPTTPPGPRHDRDARPVGPGRSGLAALALGALLVLAGCGRGDRGRVLILGIDGLDPATVDLLMSEGEMPNLARMRQEGAYGEVICPKPLLSPILWTTIATGRSPADHGIGHFVAVDPSTGAELPVTSRLRRVKALWNMAAEAGRRPVTVGWWATWPPEDVGEGKVVSDHVAYHFLFEEGFTGGGEEGKTHPPELLERIRPMLQRADDLGAAELEGFVELGALGEGSEEDGGVASGGFRDELEHFKWALATARSYRDIGLHLWREERPDLQMVYIEGTDSTSHLFGHLFRAQGLAGDLARQQERYGGTVEAMYRFADDLVGRYLEAADDDTTVIVVSDHGFELGVLHDDPTRAADLRRVSERFHRERGVLYLWGRGIRSGAKLEEPHLLDLTPTVLQLLDLPLGEDMPGRVLAEAFVRVPEPETIASWDATGEPVLLSGEAKGRDAETDAAVLERLRGLGYLSGSDAEASDAGERNLAAILFEEGRYREAARAYKKLVDAEPGDASLRTSFAGALGALERYDEALAELETALELDPLHVEGYHNRAVIRERRGETRAAVADYARALRYRPDYEPSRQALERLIGTADVHGPTNETERQAAELCARASDAARRGDYGAAMTALDQAVALAPDFPLVWQYRSNVAYLMGDREAAIRALEKGLELEPDNALFHRNLENLRALP
ncbi:MAG: alkaline phosphatase family protein [Holophagales bacterium]|nr:alkaline phosphatase family protein [Holophagales bacterium]